MGKRASGRRESDGIGESESGGRGRSRGSHGRCEDKRGIKELNGAIEEMVESEKSMLMDEVGGGSRAMGGGGGR